MGSFAEQLKLLDKTKPFFFANVCNDVPTWEEFMLHKNYTKEHRPSLFRQDTPSLFIAFGDPDNEETHLSKMESLRPFASELKEVFGQSLMADAAFIISESNEGMSGLGKHPDPGKQIHLNCVGTTQWDVWEPDKEEVYARYILNPGDAIYIPIWWPHAVTSLTSKRAGIAYTADYEIKNV